jgi:hypothetical protein
MVDEEHAYKKSLGGGYDSEVTSQTHLCEIGFCEIGFCEIGFCGGTVTRQMDSYSGR